MDPPEDAPPARLDVAERSRADDGRPAATTIRTLEGAVLEVHATRMELSRDNGAVALTMLRPSAASLIGLRLASYGLTVAQRRVATLVLQGRSTREIMNQLRISQHTVQDHLKAVFDRTGVRSRRQLVAALMG
jgi:DNA-binding CsgD family transcriptional regulator